MIKNNRKRQKAKIELRYADFRIIDDQTLDLGQGFCLLVKRTGRVARIYASGSEGNERYIYAFIPSDLSIQTIFAFLHSHWEWQRLAEDTLYVNGYLTAL